MGEFLIINKAIDDKKIDYLFYLKEDYANILKKINNNFIILPKRIKPKYKIYYHKFLIYQQFYFVPFGII